MADAGQEWAVARDKRTCVFVSVNRVDTVGCAKLLEGLYFGHLDICKISIISTSIIFMNITEW